MASQEELDREKEKSRLLEEQNRLYERQLRAQSESISLSSSLVDSLKESMGIQSRRTQFDQNLLSLSKRINKTILDQQFATTKLGALERQREKNQTIINASKSLESSLSEKLTDNDKKRVDNINNRSKALNKQLSQLDNILNLDKESREAQAGAEKELRKKIAANEAYVNTSIEGLSISAQQLLFAKQNREELEKTNAERENEISNIKSIQSQIGLVGGAASGVEKALSKLGFPELGVAKAYEDTIQLGLEAKASGDKFNAVGKFTSLLGGNLKGLLSTANLITAAIGFLVDALISTDKTSGELAKNLGISYDEALGLTGELNESARFSNNIFINTKNLVESQMQLSAALGTNAALNRDLLATQTQLTKQAGYSVEAATQLSTLSLATGKSTEDITTQFLGQAKALNLTNKLALNEKQLLESVAKTSKGTLATFASKPKELAKAVFEAKKLGLEISQVEKIADGLLDIEQSLTAEFEAEVISGKQLNLERARFFALTNDIAGVSEELGKQGITQASFAKSSRIEQEAVAAAMGMSRDELGQMLIEQNALAAIGAKDGEEARAKFEALKAQKGEAAAIAELGNSTYVQQLASASNQEKFLELTNKIKDAFVSIAVPLMEIITPIVNILAPVLSGISQTIGYIVEGFKAIAPALKVIGIVLSPILAMLGALAISSIVSAAYTALGGLPVVGPALALAAIGFGVSKFKQAKQNVQDGIAPSEKGPFTITDSFGATAITAKGDGLAVSPNIRREERNSPTNVTVTLSKNDIQEIANAVRDGASKANINVNLDGNKVSNTLQTPMAVNARRYSV